MQPLTGQMPVQGFLGPNKRGEELQHVAFNMQDLSITTRKKAMAKRIFSIATHGV
jgi:hypothetical protein